MIVRCGVIVLATVLGLLGCDPAAISRAEFQRRGNAICAATGGRIAQLATPHPAGPSRAAMVAGYVDAYVAELRQELVELRRLGYPAGERRRLTEAYRTVDRALDAAERDALGFRRASLAPARGGLRDAGLAACGG